MSWYVMSYGKSLYEDIHTAVAINIRVTEGGAYTCYKKDMLFWSIFILSCGTYTSLKDGKFIYNIQYASNFRI